MQAVRLDQDGEIALVIIDNPPVNALSAEVRDGLLDGFNRAIANPEVSAIVLMCAGSTFVAGGDIAAMGKPPTGAATMEINRTQDSSPKPIVAAIHGSALGGGLETTLASHYRIAARDAKLGLPEVHLGILPGAGGTQRLPRLVGVKQALDIILSGESLDAQEALRIGLIDAVTEGADLRAEAVAYARGLLAEGNGPRRARDMTAKLDEARADPEIFDRYLEANDNVRRGALAPAACVRSIRNAVELPFDDALQEERKITFELIPSKQSVALRHIFFAKRAAWKLPGSTRDTRPPEIGSVAVLSDSKDGTAVARAFANAGLEILSGSEKDVARADLVLDPDFMTRDAHRERLSQVAPFIRDDAIVATMAAGSMDDIVPAERCLGVHFFYPADERPLVEVIRPQGASLETSMSVLKLLKKMGKTAIVAAPSPGEIATNMMTARQKAGELLVAGGLATPEQIDVALTGFGFAEGVFAWLDRIGLDTAWIATGGSGDAMRERLCAAGRTGRAAGAGFFDYDADGNPIHSQEAIEIIGAQSTGLTVPLADALLAPIGNVGLRLLDEGVALRGSDIDLLAVVAHGWPAWTGGPVYHLETEIGVVSALDTLAALRYLDKTYYEPAVSLRAKASSLEETMS